MAQCMYTARPSLLRRYNHAKVSCNQPKVYDHLLIKASTRDLLNSPGKQASKCYTILHRDRHTHDTQTYMCRTFPFTPANVLYIHTFVFMYCCPSYTLYKPSLLLSIGSTTVWMSESLSVWIPRKVAEVITQDFYVRPLAFCVSAKRKTLASHNFNRLLQLDFEATGGNVHVADTCCVYFQFLIWKKKAYFEHTVLQRHLGSFLYYVPTNLQEATPSRLYAVGKCLLKELHVAYM